MPGGGCDIHHAPWRTTGRPTQSQGQRLHPELRNELPMEVVPPASGGHGRLCHSITWSSPPGSRCSIPDLCPPQGLPQPELLPTLTFLPRGIDSVPGDFMVSHLTFVTTSSFRHSVRHSSIQQVKLTARLWGQKRGQDRCDMKVYAGKWKVNK